MKPALGAWPERAVAAALGALQTLAFVHTQAWALPLATAAWLAWRLGRATPRQAAWLGWSYGTGWLGAGTWWLFVSLYVYGHLPALLAACAVLALAAALSLYLAAAGWAFAKLRRGDALDVPLFAALWLLAELARGVLFTGFPWVASGYAQVDSPLAALAPWLGVYGMGAVGAALAAGAVALVQRREWRPLGAAAALVVAALLAPAGFTRPAGDLRVTLLQTNVRQDEKFSAERMPEVLAWVAAGLRQAAPGLAIAPETAVPLLPAQLDDFAPGYWQGLRDDALRPGRAVLVGLPLGELQAGYTNSVAGLSAAPPYRYDKRHLVPFGEFIPTGFRWFTEALGIPLGDFTRGVANPPSFVALGQRIAPNICYEDLFGEELAARFADADRAPTVFANLSNIGWFGNTWAIPQHLAISRLRTLEFQLPMIRATNTGATAVVDHRGEVTAELAPHTRGVLEAVVQGRAGVTPFAWWASRAGLWPLLLGALAVLALRWRFRPRAGA